MTTEKTRPRLLLISAGFRFGGAMLIVAILWAGYLWATSTPGAL